MTNNLQSNNSDLLVELPTDKIQPTHSELKIIDSLFKESAVIKSKPSTTKPSILNIIFQYILLVFIIMLSYFIPTDTVKKIIPVALSNNELLPIFIKAIVVSIIFYLFQVYYIKVNFITPVD